MTEDSKIYYFISYSYKGGFGRAFVKLVEDLNIRGIEELIMDKYNLSDLVTLFYKKISYKEFIMQTKNTK